MAMSFFSDDLIPSTPASPDIPFAAPAPFESQPSPFDEEGKAEVCPPCCWRCMSDVAPLPITAKFCPRCGAGLLDGAGRVLPIPVAAAAAAMNPGAAIQAYTEEGRRRIETWLWLRAALARTSPPGTPPSGGLSRTQIVTGYAKAMYHLGERYVAGLSARRNPGEAVRCFMKSARLGNAAAKERLDGASTPECEPVDRPAV
jgi:hypothetical protein